MSWSKIPGAAEHFGVSVRSFRSLLKDTDFPRSKLPSGTTLIELQAGDQWLRDRSTENQDKQIIDSVLKGLKQ